MTNVIVAYQKKRLLRLLRFLQGEGVVAHHSFRSVGLLLEKNRRTISEKANEGASQIAPRLSGARSRIISIGI